MISTVIVNYNSGAYLAAAVASILQNDDEEMSFAVDGYELGSLSMLTAVIGMPSN